MKVLICLAAILLAVSASPRLAATPNIDLTKVTPVLEKFNVIAENFESWSPRKQIETVNDFVDLVIAEVGHFLRKYGLDPMNLPDIDQTVDLLGTEMALKLEDGVVSNASQIFREGDVTLNYEDRKLYLEVPVFFKLFTLNYDYNITIGDDYPLIGKLIGEVVLVDVKWAVDLDFKQQTIALKYLNITNMGAINVTFDGDMEDWILDIVTELVGGEMKDQIRQLVEMIVRFVMDSIFDIINDVIGSITP